MIEENTIANNLQAGCSGGTTGGGIGIGGNSTAVIRRNHIYGNTGAWLGGGIGLFAAGAPTIEFNVIRGNSATDGGGIGMVNNASPTIRGNLIVRNEAQSGGGIYWSIPTSVPGILVVNNTIADNASIAGSGVFADGYDQNARLWNNIIVAAPGQTAVFCGNSNDPHAPTFSSNDVFSATGAAYGGICADQTGFSGNISADPLFVEAATSDYHLLPESPGIDLGNDAATGLPTTDLDGHARVLDGDGDALAVVDIGADEAASAGSAPSLFAKSNPANGADGQLRAVLLTWQASAGATTYEVLRRQGGRQHLRRHMDSGMERHEGHALRPGWRHERYYRQVRAINGAGLTYANGSSSVYWSFTTEVPVLTRIIGLSGNLDFGSVLVGQSATRTLTISNSGNDVLTVTGLMYPTGFRGTWAGTIAAGGSRTVAVTFDAFAQGTYSGTIRVIADQTDGESGIAVSGTALPVTRFMSLTGDLTFGNVQAGMTATRTLTISNRGNDTLSVFNVGYPNGFSGSWFGTIAPGASQTVSVTFAPTISTSYTGTITVSANQTFGSNVVSATGVGTPAPGMQMLWQNLATGSLEAWYVQGATVMTSLPLGIDRVTDLNWRVVGTGDLNGDGMPDIVWRHAVDGWVAVWFMRGNAVLGTEWLSIDRVADVNWTIRAIGDVDGNGRADLIWQHVRDGWIAVWFMSGSQVGATSYLSINRLSLIPTGRLSGREIPTAIAPRTSSGSTVRKGRSRSGTSMALGSSERKA